MPEINYYCSQAMRTSNYNELQNDEQTPHWKTRLLINYVCHLTPTPYKLAFIAAAIINSALLLANIALL